MRTALTVSLVLSLVAAGPEAGSVDRSPLANPVTVAPLRASGNAFGASLDLTPVKGYVEEEFLLRGRANRYRITDPQADARVIDTGHAYVTRALVRRPARTRRFNGTVVVEWLNVSAGQDIDFLYAATRDVLLREGYAWVGVSVQHVGIDALKRWNPDRYGMLDASASNVDPADGKDIDPPSLSAPSPGDVLGWDIFSQAGSTVRDPASPLLGGLPVKHVIAAGQSQSSFRLSYYINSIQPLHRVYDGFLLYDRGGPFPLRTDIPAKIVSVGTEFMTDFIGGPGPDTENQRWWEIAGASHNSLAEIDDYLDPLVRRTGALKSKSGEPVGVTGFVLGTGSCTPVSVWSRVPNADVMNAALKALNAWISGGAAPPALPRLVVDAKNKVARDAQGRAIGGIRTAAFEAPIAGNVGMNAVGPCMLAGSHTDFTPPQLCQAYGSEAGYRKRVRVAVEANVRDGVILPDAARRTLKQAAALHFSCAAN
ncbi:MAG: hypothetical protein RLZZ200_1227 [Pseudomonadota bacterium]|jgi:hypothetical protein